ncbi:MAG: hypothetical protein HZA34_01495 [Candidatus Pacebacteria bacterium]|nr:hypothetical protein [Candidatus Paceibacterota bacterium]
MKVKYIVLFIVFLIFRLWVLQHPPQYYSDVKQDYERYANQWRYGLTPYRKILFEYPPAVIPLISLPLEIDQRGIGKYYQNYRIEIFIFELLLFSLVLHTVFRLPCSTKLQWSAILFYILAGVVAKDYWYEGIDLIFFGLFSLSMMWAYLKRQNILLNRVVTWALFWLSVAIKIMTAPLAIPLLMTKKLSLRREILACFLGGVLVWGLPLVLYRSSLSVFVVFHANRPMKYGAFGTYLVEVINDVTKTESRLQQGPDFPMVGPVAKKVTQGMNVIFPWAILGVLLYGYKKLSRKNMTNIETFTIFLRTSLLYLFALFLTGKTFSSPFHIWYIPLLTLYPFRSFQRQFVIFALAMLMLGLDTTPYLAVPKDVFLGMFPLTRFRDALRFIPMVFCIVFFIREQKYA